MPVDISLTTDATSKIETMGHGLLSRLIAYMGLHLWRYPLQTEPQIAISDEFYDVGPSRIEFTQKYKALEAMGVVQGFHARQIPPDEPFQHSVSVRPLGYGTDLYSLDRALWKALGENIERYLWKHSDTYYREDLTEASYSEIDSPLELFELAGFSREQRAAHARLQFNAHTRFAWTTGWSLTEERTSHLPVQLVSAHYNSTSEPRLWWPITTGLATASSLEEAALKGLLEVIERDAFMINYLNRITPQQINLTEAAAYDSEIDSVVEACARYNITPHVVILPTDFPTHVCLAILTDDTENGPTVAVGARASFTLRDCVLDSLSEALTVRTHQRRLLSERSNETLNTQSLNQIGRLRYWARKNSLSDIQFFLDGEKVLPSWSKPSSSVKEQKDALVRALRKKGYTAHYKELTNKDFWDIGFYTVMVVVPQLQPLHLNESLPYFGGERLRSVPETLGLKVADTLNTMPHPFP